MQAEIPTSFGGGRFVVEKELGRGGMGIVYEAFDKERDMRVALKTLLHMDADSLYYFKREFRSLHDIVHPNLCFFMELFKDEETWFFTMELIHGVDFLSYVDELNLESDSITDEVNDQGGTGQENSAEQGARWKDASEPRTFNEPRLRKCLAGLCKGLNALHAAGKVHRDIKPSNVMVTGDDRVVLLDFGLIMEKESAKSTSNRTIVGSAAYMSPEQTDTEFVGPEADLYSMGVMLYEVLTGKLPFEGTVPKILMEKQLSDPIRPSSIKPGLPSDLELLCLDLLRRDPRERPSTLDVIEIIEGNRTKSSTSIPPDITAHQQGNFFIGRQAELQVLNTVYQDVLKGRFGAVIIEGVSGIGKTAIVEKFINELESDSSPPVVLRGRCYEFESAPFKAFDGAIDSLIHFMHRVSDEESLQLLPSNLDLLLRLFPALQRSSPFVNSSISKVEIEDPHELQIRSFNAFKELLFRLSSQHSLILVVDDMQWTDSDSLALLKQLANGKDSPAMMLVLISRFAEDARNLAVDWDDVVSINKERIQLDNLDVNDSEELTRRFIKMEKMPGHIDATSVATEAAGHPLYIAELVNHIALGGEAWKNLRIDEVISRRVKTLPNTARQLLRMICVASSPLKWGDLQNLAQMESQDFFNIIAYLRMHRLLRSRGPKMDHHIEPYHDRVREAVVAHDLTSFETAKIHLDIGRYFLRTYSEEELEENIFYVVQQLSSGIDLISDETEKRKLAELLFLAGKKARGSAAFVSSLVYFKESIALFPSASWKTHYDTVFSLYCAAAEAAFVTGNFSTTKKFVSEAKTQAKSHLDLSKIYEIYVQSLDADGKPHEAIDEAIGMIRKLGIKMPQRPGKCYLLMKILATKLRLHKKSEDELINLPHNKDKNINAALRLVIRIVSMLYFHRPVHHAVIELKVIALSLKHGIDYASSLAFLSWAFINGAFLKNYKEAYKYGLIAMKMQEQFENNSKYAFAIFVFATFVQHWNDHIRMTLPNLLKCHDLSYKLGDLAYVAHSGTLYCCNSFYTGRNLPEVVELFQHYGEEIEQKNQQVMFNLNRIHYQTALNLMVSCQTPTDLVGTIYNETVMVSSYIKNENRNNLAVYFSCKLFIQIFFGSYTQAHKSVLELEKYRNFSNGIYRAAMNLFYISLACLKYRDEAPPRTKRELLRRVRKNQRKYKKIAKASPSNHAHKYTLVEAERARVKRKYKKAPALYDQAIAGAIEQEFTQDAALACEFAADFYREIGDEKMTMAYAKDALGHYEKWGAFAKVEHVKEKFGIE